MFKSKKVFFGLLIAAVAAFGLAGYFYYQLNVIKKNPEEFSQKETADLVEKVSMLVVLPTGENPTVATVSDPEALKAQEFFAKAEIGDKVLIYAQAKKAILYSVNLNKILEIAPLNSGDQTIKPNSAPAR